MVNFGVEDVVFTPWCVLVCGPVTLCFFLFPQARYNLYYFKWWVVILIFWHTDPDLQNGILTFKLKLNCLFIKSIIDGWFVNKSICT